jgi:hypothetical protein
VEVIPKKESLFPACPLLQWPFHALKYMVHTNVSAITSRSAWDAGVRKRRRSPSTGCAYCHPVTSPQLPSTVRPGRCQGYAAFVRPPRPGRTPISWPRRDANATFQMKSKNSHPQRPTCCSFATDASANKVAIPAMDLGTCVSNETPWGSHLYISCNSFCE